MRSPALIAGFMLLSALPGHAQDSAAAAGTFIDASGTELGSVTLTQGDGAVSVIGDVMGIAPGEHGFHFHQTGDCDSSTAFESAGAHFNPNGHQHGLENPQGPHAGDLLNITASDQGMAMIDVSTDTMSLWQDDPAYIFDADGTALVIHAAPDDQSSDPSGNSGDRIACAVIEAAPAQ